MHTSTRRLRSLRIVLGTVVLVGLAGAACQTFQPYPPDFRYVSGAELRTAMDRIAQDVVRLDAVLKREQALLPDERDEIVRLLTDVQAQAESLGASSGQKTNHPVLDENLPRFLAEVDLARRAAQAEPPNYYPAGRVSGTCIACHAVRR